MPFDSRLIDGTLYPDEPPPRDLEALSDRVDYLARLCSAWDFGILPDPQIVTEIRENAWREAVEACRLLTSPVYHLLRQWHALERLPYLGQELAYIRDDPNLSHI